ncbi:MAG TPA: exodeoxyribonuclease V subunit beta [Kiritimatiellia bacterium]|jgi:exodeoxyribonuclease V beta subunit|nr:exodeoxyribonuclease V subunit beta [Kiritimatiellia bacterium]HOU59513.1 exodeoxyribonuclease V subunit beta [Kiritimatiellia bacterium]HPV47297.1 exodeoxyribonuclease V subunit beta [Kiritimatiellia bacterium]HQF19736.1 exodeoxyribonuclease V subunit beta [Kiritimatiellia bacterium]HQG75206.1 exodeoxyribonuclease V subunit beta [Kiritimatiellia bacterium]
MSDFSNLVFSPTHAFDTPQLVEASAGTGKTYNIQNVFLRLILEKNLSVREILVVTFTNAATCELRERLRNVLLDCRYYLEAPPAGALTPEQQRIHDALQLVPHKTDEEIQLLKQRVQLAIMDFDSAAIITIHGFCQRVLKHYAFECGHDPDAELMPEASHIIREACQDWWRKNAYTPSPDSPNPFEKIGQLIQLVTELYKHPTATIRAAALPDTPAFQDATSACKTVFTGFKNMRGNFNWKSKAIITRVDDTVDASPVFDSIKQNPAEWDAWAAAQRELPAPRHELGESFLTIVNTASAPPTTGNAKPFVLALQCIAQTAAQNLLLAPQAKIAQEIRADITTRIRDRAALTYDAMLTNVRDVLRTLQTGDRLRAVLRKEFRAALIDEFQDTDPVQYDIFWNLFSEGSIPLVFVGDPKQAIYGFRGGDIFTYYGAKEAIAASHQHSLETNFRSEANLVAAINEFFADPVNGRTFQNEHIAYSGQLKANDVPAAKALLVDGARDDQPFHIWTLDDPQQKDWSSPVAREIVRLLSDPKTTIGGSPVRPNQIAVLVNTHKEAAAVESAIKGMSVNAVRQATDNIFNSPEAANLSLLMAAVLEPGKGRAIRNALASGLLPCTHDDLRHYNAASDNLSPGIQPPAAASRPFEEWSEFFHGAGERWNQYSFMEAIQYLFSQLEVLPHLAASPDGTERIADLRHLIEIIHQAARSKKLGPIALTRWFNRQRKSEFRDKDGDDDATARVSDDSDAVQIMTHFKSKGLQFPIVFAPTLWKLQTRSVRADDATCKYHENNQLILDLDTASAAGKEKAKTEAHQENIRKIYVALTRAINRVYLFAADGNPKPEQYALSWLLEHVSGTTPHILRSPVPTDLPTAPWQDPTPPPAPESLQPRALNNPVDKSHGHASFSSLMPHPAAAAVITTSAAEAAADAPVRDIDQATEAIPPTAEIVIDPGSILAIPGGAKVGNCWHDIFEHIDFTHADSNPDAINEIIEITLNRYRLLPKPPANASAELRDLMTKRRAAVRTMVFNTLHTPLQPLGDAPTFALKDIPIANRRSEMEFNFSLQDDNQHRLNGIGEILDKQWNSTARNEEFIARLLRSEAAIPRGFMTGFMDLVFHHNNRFYIVDWKSNRLDGKIESFGPAGLAAEMSRNAYYLQYLIYSVALHGFLAARLKNYSFDDHYGGAFYLFVRGMDGKTDSGVFHDKPSRELIESLAKFLGGTP